jgi:hypothetical protein
LIEKLDHYPIFRKGGYVAVEERMECLQTKCFFCRG